MQVGVGVFKRSTYPYIKEEKQNRGRDKSDKKFLIPLFVFPFFLSQRYVMLRFIFVKRKPSSLFCQGRLRRRWNRIPEQARCSRRRPITQPRTGDRQQQETTAAMTGKKTFRARRLPPGRVTNLPSSRSLGPLRTAADPARRRRSADGVRSRFED